MRGIVGVLGAAVLAGGLVSGSAGSASTSGTADPASGPPWIPFEQPDITYPAGERCEFEVFGKVLHDREFFKNVTTYADGTPRTQLWKGPLIIRLTNTETGESVDVNASGRSFFQYGPGEAFESITIQSGHFLAGTSPGSEPGPGIFLVTGQWSSMSRHDDGTSTIFVGPGGSVENMCDVLAD